MTRREPILRRPRSRGGTPAGVRVGLARHVSAIHPRSVALVVAMTAAVTWLGGGSLPRAAGQPLGQSAEPSPVADSAPLFTPGPGSVGAASALESRAPAADVGSKLRQGWNVGGLIDLDASTSGARVSRELATVDALSGTEFEGTKPPPPMRRDGPGSGQPQRPRAERPSLASAGDSRPAPGPRAAVASPEDTPDPALTGDCGWLGLGCLSGGMWALIGSLGAVGAGLVALIVRELYFAR